MLIGIAYLALFLAAGLLLAQWAVPDGSPAVTVPLGCGFGVSLLAALPAGFALVCGFTLRAVWLAAAGAALLCAVLIFAGRGHIRFARDPDRGAMWLCLLPVLAVTLYLLHTHVLHKVNGTLHTGQSCYGDMPMHLGFIEYIAQSGQFPPRYPLLAGAHRFGYPFLCETVSSVFRLLGAGRRAAYLLPMVPAFVSVYGMFWQLARRVLGSAGKACLAFYLFFMGSGFGFVYFLKDAATFKGIFTGFYTTPTNYTTKNIVWVNPIVDLLIPQRATLFGWCVLFAALYLLHTHVLHGVNGTLHTGQSCYGDMPMHLGFIEYIAQSGQFPPRYPLLAGAHRFGYPFLCETVSSVFRLLGAGRRAAYLLPMVPAFVSLYGMFWQLARRMLGSAGKACLAFYLFFMGSGFGFAYFLKDAATFKGIFTGFYTTPTNYTTKNIVWVNPIVDLLIPQRATLFGWCVLFAALYLLWRFAFEGESHLWLPLAVLVLPLPLLQTHSALALVFLCLAGGLYTLARRPRTAKILLPWLGLAAVCGVCWLAEMSGTVLAQSLDGTNMLRLHFNWVNGNGDGTLKDPWLWFYVKNIGLVFLLILPAVRHAGTRQRWLFGGGAALWLLAEFVVFQPNNYDNNKLLFITHALGCMLAAQLLADWAKRLRTPALRAAVVAVCCFVGMFGSMLTVGRELVSDYQQWDAADIALADYISENAESDALFLTSDSHLTPVFALAGRRIVCGSSSWVYFHGMDYGAEYAAMQALYETPDEDTLQTWGVDYVVFDGSALARFDTDEDWYAARYPMWYEDGICRVYKITTA